MLDTAIELLTWLKTQGTPGKLGFFCGVILPIFGLIWGTRAWAKRRYDIDISQVRALRDQLTNRDETLTKRDARIADLESQLQVLPQHFLERLDAEARDGNFEREIALADDWLAGQSDALHRAYATLTQAAILDALEDGAVGYENARLSNMGARAAKPRDPATIDLEAELAAAAAAESQGLKVKLNAETREDRRERRAGLPKDLAAITRAVFAHRDKGRYQLMEMLARHGLRMAKRAAGPAARETLMFERHVAEAEWHAGKPAAALDRLQTLSAPFKAAYADDPQHHLYVRYLIATCLQNTGDPAAALTAAQELLKDWERISGTEHPHTLATRHLIASCLQDTGDPAAALTAAQDLLKDQDRISGPDHPYTLATRHLIASCLQDTGDPAAALTAAQDLLKDRERIIGPEHPSTLITRNLIAACLRDTGEPAAALTAAQELLKDFERLSGPEHPNTLATRYLIGRCQHAAGALDDAFETAEATLTSLEQIRDPGHWRTLRVRTLLARILLDRGDKTGARDMHKDVVARFEAAGVTPGNPDMRRAMDLDAALA